MRGFKIAAVLAGALALGACQTGGYGGYGPKTIGGGVLGAAAGGYLGSQFGSGSGQLAATAAGALLGAFAGGSAGRSLDRADAVYAERAYGDAVYSNDPVQWRNPQSGHSGSFDPGPVYYENGRACQRVRHTYYGPNGPQDGYATACRMPDGSWRTY